MMSPLQAFYVFSHYLRDAERWDELESFQMSIRLYEMKFDSDGEILQSRTPSELALSIFRRAMTQVLPFALSCMPAV
jgi:hypothetical protein